MPDRGIGIIITPAACLAGEVVHVQADCVAEDQLLEADADAKAQRAGAQSADRAGCELEHAHGLAIDAQLGVDRPFAQAERSAERAVIRSISACTAAGSRDGVT